jgi:hypothetical protein
VFRFEKRHLGSQTDNTVKEDTWHPANTADCHQQACQTDGSICPSNTENALFHIEICDELVE